MPARANGLNGHGHAPPRKAAPPKEPPPKRKPAAAKPAAKPKGSGKPARPAQAHLDDAGLAARRIYAAQLARRTAESEWLLALSAGVGAGVIPDTAATPEPVGTNRVVYADASLQITLQVAAPIAGLNVPGFVADLVRAGVAQKLVDRLAVKHGTETRPAHKLVCTPLGS